MTELRLRVAFGLLMAFIVGWYWMPSTSAVASAPHNFFFYLIVMPALWVAFLGRTGAGPSLSTALVVSSATLMAYLAASSLWVQFPIERSPTTVLLHALATATFTAGVYHLFDRSRFRLLATIIVGAAASITIVSIVAFLLGRTYHIGRLHSAIHFEHPNLFAQALGFAALLALGSVFRARAQSSRIKWIAATILLGLGVLMTGSRAVMIAVLAAGLLSIALYRGRKVATVALLVVIIAVSVCQIVGPTVMDFVARGDAGRIQIWKTLLDRNPDHPMIGAGINANDDVVFSPGSWEFPDGFTVLHAHSAFVGTLYYGGLIGFTLLILVSGLGIKTGWKHATVDGEWDPLVLLIFGLCCLIPDGHRLVSEPHLTSWLVFWLPIGLIAAGPFGSQQSAVRQAPAVDTSETEERRKRRLPLLGGALTLILVLAALILRAPHMEEKIDGPHTWRQCDTAQYIHAFYTDGIDLLKPSVCWMGDHKTVIFEFPLPEAVTAVAYHIFGPSHVTARWVTLFFFVGSTCFLFGFVRSITDRATARLAAVISMVLPLALYYSRAIHIDYSALFFAYAMAWLWVEAIKRNSPLLLWLGSIPAGLALIIKAPYVLPFVPLLICMTISRDRWKLIFKHAPAIIMPGLVFAVWQWHTLTVNGAAPDWFFIPTYRLFTNNSHWYFGPLSMRLDLALWWRIVYRVLYEVTGWTGVVLALVGLGFSAFERRWAYFWWIAGCGLSVLVFFNLNVIHNYYQIILVGPASVAIALGALHLAALAPARPVFKKIVVVALLLGVAAESVRWSEKHYFRVLEPLRTAGVAIGEIVPEGELVVVSAGGLDPRSPHLLYRARRYGWSIPDRDLTPNLVRRLEEVGATWLAIVNSKPPNGALKTYLAGVPSRTVNLPGGQARLFVFHLTERTPPLFEDGFEGGVTEEWLIVQAGSKKHQITTGLHFSPGFEAKGSRRSEIR